MAKHSMYDENPRLAHDEDGNVKVKKDAKKESPAGDTGEPDSEGLDDLIKQHKEMKAMHDKHQADMMDRIKKRGATSGSDDVGAPIKDIEKDAK
jgi:hypothetical protein